MRPQRSDEIITNMKKKANEAAARIEGLEAAVLVAESRFASDDLWQKVGNSIYVSRVSRASSCRDESIS